MNELKTSIKRIYTRFIILTVVVVFGAIAIAQAQKEGDESQASQHTQEIASTFDEPRPIPVDNNDKAARNPSNHAASSAESAKEGIEKETVPPNSEEAGAVEPETVDTAWGTKDHNEIELADYEQVDLSRRLDEPPASELDAELPERESLPRSNPVRGQQVSDLPALPADQPSESDLEPPALLDDTQLPAARDTSSYGRPQESASNLIGNGPRSDVPSEGETPLDAAADFESADSYLPQPSQTESQTELQGAEPQQYDPFGSASPQKATTAAPYDLDAESPSQPTNPESTPGLLPQATSDDQSPSRLRASSPTQAGDLPTAKNQASDESTVERLSPGDHQAGAAASPAALPTGQQADDFSRRAAVDDAANPQIASATRPSAMGNGKPGPQTMEGPQTPSLTVHKTAPREVQVGQSAKFEIRVRNVGSVPADNVVIRDVIPAGTEFIDATPKATQGPDGSIHWEMGSLPPGQEISVAIHVKPTTEGLVGSVARVLFEAAASARTRSTKPDLVLEHTGPLKVLLGEAVRFSIKLSNPGSGAATNVVLEEDVPVGLSHSSGSKLEYEVGTIQPGQTRHLELTLKAADAGHVINKLVARADGNLLVEDAVELDVVSPKLQVTVDGPSTRYLERPVTYTVTVANPGTAAARNVELNAHLPSGLKFVSTNNSGYFDQSRNAVIWSLEKLPAGEMGRAQFTAMPIQMGSYQIRAASQADMGLQASHEHPLRVEGIAALAYTLTDKVDPIGIGGQTTYELKVTNQGSKDATNVRFVAQVPEGMRPLSAQGPTSETIEGQSIQFAPLDRLQPKGQATFRIMVHGQAAGDHRFRVQMTSDEIKEPVTKEESTRIYAD